MLQISATADGDRPECVLLHGMGSSAGVFRAQIAFLSDKGGSLAIEAPGHGHTPAWPTFEIPTVAAAMADVIAERAANPVVLVGHSMGGVLGWEIAARRPNLARALLLLDGAPFLTAEQKSMQRQACAMIEAPSGDTALEMLFESMFGPNDDPLARSRLMEKLRRTPLQVVRQCLRALTDFDPEQTERLTVPVTAMVTDNSVAGAAMLAERYPDARITHLSGAGHYLPIFAAAEVNAAIADLLRGR